MRTRAVVACLVFGLFAPGVANAQVNTEKLRSWEKAGLSGSLDFSLTYKSGNVDLLVVGTSVRAQWARLEPTTTTTTATTATAAPGRLVDLVYLIGDLSLGIRADSRFRNGGFGHVRWTRMYRPWLGSEVFAQAQYNEFIRLQQRFLGGAGVRFEPVRTKHFEAAIGTGYMLEFEQNDVPEDGPDERRVLAHRSTSYVSLKAYASDPEVSLVTSVYLQPRLTDFSDYRLLNENELAVKVTDNLQFVAGVYVRYDSEPVAEVESVDLTVENKIRVTF